VKVDPPATRRGFEEGLAREGRTGSDFRGLGADAMEDLEVEALEEEGSETRRLKDERTFEVDLDEDATALRDRLEEEATEDAAAAAC